MESQHSVVIFTKQGCAACSRAKKVVGFESDSSRSNVVNGLKVLRGIETIESSLPISNLQGKKSEYLPSERANWFAINS